MVFHVTQGALHQLAPGDVIGDVGNVERFVEARQVQAEIADAAPHAHRDAPVIGKDAPGVPCVVMLRPDFDDIIAFTLLQSGQFRLDLLRAPPGCSPVVGECRYVPAAASTGSVAGPGAGEAFEFFAGAIPKRSSVSDVFNPLLTAMPSGPLMSAAKASAL